MHMLFSFLQHLFALDLPWFAGLVMGNLFFLFAFCALAHFLFGRGKMLKGLVLISLMLWSQIEMTNIFGLVWAVGGFLMLNYMSRVAIVLFAENTKQLKSRLVIVMFFQFYVLVAVYNLILT